jgi:hypothetical protein
MEPDLVITVDKQNEVCIVPVGWQRFLESGRIVYISPTRQRLVSYDQVQLYLQTDGTCKCGLRCPVRIEHTFNFDASVPSLICDFETGENAACLHRGSIRS